MVVTGSLFPATQPDQLTITWTDTTPADVVESEVQWGQVPNGGPIPPGTAPSGAKDLMIPQYGPRDNANTFTATPLMPNTSRLCRWPLGGKLIPLPGESRSVSLRMLGLEKVVEIEIQQQLPGSLPALHGGCRVQQILLKPRQLSAAEGTLLVKEHLDLWVGFPALREIEESIVGRYLGVPHRNEFPLRSHEQVLPYRWEELKRERAGSWRPREPRNISSVFQACMNREVQSGLIRAGFAA